MDVTPLIPQGAQVIQAYTGGRFRISGAQFDAAVIVHPDHTDLWESPPALAALTLSDIQALMQGSPETPDILLIGCGADARGISFDLRQSLRAQGLFVEFMDTGAACRTFNVLMAEGRRVAAALLPL